MSAPVNEHMQKLGDLITKTAADHSIERIVAAMLDAFQLGALYAVDEMKRRFSETK